MGLCLAAGFGVSLVWHPASLGKGVQAEIPKPEPTATSPPRRDRTLHLESLWSQRRTTLNASEAAPRVLAAIAAGNWDDASKKEAVSLLIKDPAFINAIWDKSEPETRGAMISELIKVLVNTTPRTALDVLDAGQFDFSKIPEIGHLMSQTVRYGRSPIDALDAAKRNKDKLGQEAFEGMLHHKGSYPEIARAMLADAALGMLYAPREIENACAALLRKDGALPPGTAGLEEVKAFFQRKAAQDQTTAWLAEGRTLTVDEMETLDAKGVSKAVGDAIWREGKSINAAQLELLAAAGHGKQQKSIFAVMIELGRTKEALRLLDEIKDMPASRPLRNELIPVVATSVYYSGGDVGEVFQLMGGMTDDPVYWKSMTEVLTNWVMDDPPAGRAYLEQVTDPELRRSLEESISKASLDP